METPKPRTKVEAMAWFMAYHRAPTSADLKHAADNLEDLHALGWTIVPLDVTQKPRGGAECDRCRLRDRLDRLAKAAEDAHTSNP